MEQILIDYSLVQIVYINIKELKYIRLIVFWKIPIRKFQNEPYPTFQIYIQIRIEFDPIAIGDRMVSTRLAIKYTFERRDYTDEP